MTSAREVILGVMNDVQGVSKKDKNLAQGFSFRGIDAVVNAVGPAFRKHGGFLVPKVINKTASILPTKNGGSMNAVALEVEFAIYGSEGEPITGAVASEAFDSGDKATAKAMSVALRTFLLQALLLPTDEPDPDSQSYEIGQHTIAALTQPEVEKIVALIKAAPNKATLREIWKTNAANLDQQYPDDFGSVTTLKAQIVARQNEVGE
jgi:hypothetical protein